MLAALRAAGPSCRRSAPARAQTHSRCSVAWRRSSPGTGRRRRRHSASHFALPPLGPSSCARPSAFTSRPAHRGGRTRLLTLVSEPKSVARFLDQLGEPTDPPARASARGPLSVPTRDLVRLKPIIPVTDDFEEMLENVVRIPRSATVRHPRALAEAMERGYIESVEQTAESRQDEASWELRV